MLVLLFVVGMVLWKLFCRVIVPWYCFHFLSVPCGVSLAYFMFLFCFVGVLCSMYSVLSFVPMM